MMVGIAANLALTRPQSVAGIITAAGVGAVGALISDIDVGTSASHKEADKVVGLTVLVVIATIALEYFTNIKLLDKVANDSGTLRIVLGVILFVAVCAFGKEQPHKIVYAFVFSACTFGYSYRTCVCAIRAVFYYRFSVTSCDRYL